MTAKTTNDAMSWVEIDTKALRANIRALMAMALSRGKSKSVKDKTKNLRPAEILPVIKADAYGHGMFMLAKLLEKEGVGFFAVSDVREGIILRKNGFQEKVLLLETSLPSQAKEVVENNLTPTVCTIELAKALNAAAKAKGRMLNIHIKVDTGMGRLGIAYSEALGFIKKVRGFSNLTIEGLYTHFPLADTNLEFTQKQVAQISLLVDKLKAAGIRIPYIHAANSAGFVGCENDLFNLARPGLMLYGLYPNAALKKKIKLAPAMSVKARVIFTKKIPKGQGISYGHLFVAPREMTVAVVSIGYSDGYFRSLSNKSKVLIKGQVCPLLGRVTMDQIIVDVTNLKGVRVGDEVVVLGTQKGKEISADELAELAGTINYEITCNLGNRLSRIYK